MRCSSASYNAVRAEHDASADRNRLAELRCAAAGAPFASARRRLWLPALPRRLDLRRERTMRELLARLLDLLDGLQGRLASPMASLDRSLAAAGHAHTTAPPALAGGVAQKAPANRRRAALAAQGNHLEA